MIKIEKKYDFTANYLIDIINSKNIICPHNLLIWEILKVKEFLDNNLNDKYNILITFPSLSNSFSESLIKSKSKNNQFRIIKDFSKEIPNNFLLLTSITALYNFKDPNFKNLIDKNIDNLIFIHSKKFMNFTNRIKILDKYIDGIEFNKWLISVNPSPKKIVSD